MVSYVYANLWEKSEMGFRTKAKFDFIVVKTSMSNLVCVLIAQVSCVKSVPGNKLDKM